MSTVFRGVFFELMGGFLTVRGYAKLSDLARCFSAHPAYRPVADVVLQNNYLGGGCVV